MQTVSRPILSEKPASRKEKAIQTTTERAATLFFDGYRAEPYADRPGVYAVYQPEGRKLPKGCALWYDVDIANGECDCTGFEMNGTCKHLIGVLKIVADALRLVSPMLPATLATTVRDLNDYGTLPNEPKPGEFAPAWTVNAQGKRSDAAMWD